VRGLVGHTYQAAAETDPEGHGREGHASLAARVRAGGMIQEEGQEGGRTREVPLGGRASAAGVGRRGRPRGSRRAGRAWPGRACRAGGASSAWRRPAGLGEAASQTDRQTGRQTGRQAGKTGRYAMVSCLMCNPCAASGPIHF
jgi:hypothetical protein